MKQSTICPRIPLFFLLLRSDILWVVTQNWNYVCSMVNCTYSSLQKPNGPHVMIFGNYFFTKQICKRCRIVHQERVHVLTWKWEATRGTKHACPSAERVGLYCCSGKSISTEKGIRGFHNCPQEKSNVSLRWRILEVCMYSRRLNHKKFKRKRVHIMTDAFWSFHMMSFFHCVNRK